MSRFMLRLVSSALLLLTVACTPVSFFFSEHLSDRFGSVWMTVQSVVLINDEDLPIIIYAESQGFVVNVNDEESMAELFSLRNIPEDTYNSLQVTFANTVIITDLDGGQQEYQLGGEDFPGRFEIPCLQIVTEDDPTAIAIEFDLNELVIGEGGLDLKPAMGCQNSGAVKSLAKNNARWKGEVLEVIDDTSFVLSPQFLYRDSEIIVNLSEAGVVFDEFSGQSSEDTSLLSEGDRVRVFGGFDFATLSLDALSVSIKPGRDEDEDDSDDVADKDNDSLGNRGFTEVEGVVVSFDGSVMAVAVSDADFAPPAGNQLIVDVSAAHFQRGSLEILAVGQEVELRGSWDGTAYTVKFVNIDGARPGQSMADKALLKVSGELVSVDDTLLTVSVSSLGGGDDEALPELMTVEIAEAFLARGRADCLVPGANIEAWGSLDDTEPATFIATQVKIKGQCDKSGDDDDDDDIDPIPTEPVESS
ncbi:MAG: hypothetical protein ACI9GW_000926 [Halieaceae bacterium]|jgi:hypothetical protein